MSALVDAGPAPANASRFRALHGADWARLDAIVTLIERRSLRALADDDLLALPLLYRSALSSLSLAREVSLDRALVAYLEQLCTRAYFQVYGPPASFARQAARFFARDWPLAVQALWRETLAAAALTAVAALLGYLLVAADPSWFYGIVPEAMAGGRDPSAGVELLRGTIYGHHEHGMLAAFATFLFTHNAQIALFSFALGFAFAVPALMLVAYNGLGLGAMLAVFVPKGLGFGFAAWLAIHGTTELFAVALSGAAGARVGLAIAFPGRRSRPDAAVAAGRTAATAMIGVVLMLCVAGLLEGIGRQTVVTDGPRLAIGLAVLSGWLLYYYLPRRFDALAPAA